MPPHVRTRNDGDHNIGEHFWRFPREDNLQARLERVSDLRNLNGLANSLRNRNSSASLHDFRLQSERELHLERLRDPASFPGLNNVSRDDHDARDER